MTPPHSRSGPAGPTRSHTVDGFDPDNDPAPPHHDEDTPASGPASAITTDSGASAITTDSGASAIATDSGGGRPAATAAVPADEPIALEPVADIRLRDGVGFAFRVFVAVWIGWALLSLLGVLIFPSGTPVSVPGLTAQPLSPGWHNLFTGGVRQDAFWFQRIAMDGYRIDDGSAAFFPLYPLAIFLLSLVPGVSTLFAATIIAQASFFGALVVLYALTAREFGVGVARRTSVYLAVFPTAFFFLAPYTEAPFLLLSLLVFWYARADRWRLVVLPAVAVGLTRSVGVVLAAALAVEAVAQWRRHGRALLPRLAAAAAPVVGLALYGLYWAVVHDDLMAPLNAQHNWARVPTLAPVTLYHALQSALRYQSYWLIDLLVVGVIMVAVVAGLRLVRPSYLTYAILSLLLPLSEPFPPRPLMSMPRFVAVLFPAFWVIAVAVERRKIPDRLVIGMFCGGYALLGLLFLDWYAIF